MAEYPYKVNFDRVEKYLRTLTEKERLKVLKLVEQLQIEGKNLPRFNGNWAEVMQE